ncbi:MAG TPA: cysteine dioxygenase family protein [Thermoanaerobaculia bacterium]
MKTQVAVVDPLIERLCDAVRLGEVNAIAEQIKSDLESFIPAEGLILPEKFHQAKPDSYARRLLYQDHELGFTALVMTWGPGQRTALHDHAGIWCVEGVLEGKMEVMRYELMEEEDGVCRFEKRGSVQATAGSAGALIPPFEHHVLANALPDRPSLTLHVYGGEMTHCDVFQPLADAHPGLYRRSSRALSYDE